MVDLINKHERHADYVRITQTGMHKRVPQIEGRRDPINLGLLMFDMFAIVSLLCAVATLKPEWLRAIWDFLTEAIIWLIVTL